MFQRSITRLLPKTIKAAVFKKAGDISLDEKPMPVPKLGEALIQITTTTICGSDIHLRSGETAAQVGVTVGHEPIGKVVQLGEGVTGFEVGQRVLCGAITPCGTCSSCQEGMGTQCGGPAQGCKLGFSLDGSQAEYMIVPHANYNLTSIPKNLTDEQVLSVPDILSTGLLGSEYGDVRVGDTVVVFAQGPIGLCAVAGARLMGATTIIAVDGLENRLEMSKKMGADHTLNYNKCNPVEEVLRLTEGRGADVAIEALGSQVTFDQALRSIKPGGRLSSLGVYAHDINVSVAMEGLAMGMSAKQVSFGLCPGGRERLRRLLNAVQSGRVNMEGLVTHRFKLDEIEKAYDLFANQRDGVLKIAITP
ncbi:alcohol dehydrogenase [Angomonas deanei]|uniref:Alcohol dehydrogenase GroES-like domain/Zinc-binding dehydrogenase, putative n=1 Tax=Angomonas deanei TaxID=59799 RepID=S9UWX1_9TRYP|nr:alcohol dehydrogenase [Angomonas deanei]EPY15014.1 alcohol dehydrogenase [Angomonas deanei]EPY15023.1 alcohol dehydrogenase [Angomonas deanei]EPY20633.1 alcohol dehydrogenase [Angomonas deanei]CAD2212791.1 Alcohol dehydrogenase GroES-like domain/Zinc-binding dehydrogenase, putative [Angomonas deanei]|eukprot:EPY15005.1 alcohol dehydrogenase [Angomonas deanei]